MEMKKVVVHIPGRARGTWKLVRGHRRHRWREMKKAIAHNPARSRRKISLVSIKLWECRDA